MWHGTIKSCLVGLLVCLLLTNVAMGQQPSITYTWQKQEAAPSYRGKQDDIHFINPRQGWYVNGAGQIWRTRDGGAHWTQVTTKPGTFFRCIGFVDSLRGYAGNIGTEYFPNVSDTIPLYATQDGGETWAPVNYAGPRVKGLCAIHIQHIPFINSGKLDHKVKIWAAGRVGSPAYLMESSDGGATWTSRSLGLQVDYILDITFTSERDGIICAAKGAGAESLNAVILQTRDGGKTWVERYRSTRPYETTWKAAFPTPNVGYVTLQSYNPDTSVKQRYVLKTIDGGTTWAELPAIVDFSCREFGVGFVTENLGWVGCVGYGLQTTDGGKTWSKVDIGRAANKLRILKTPTVGTPTHFTGYAIGTNVFKVEGPIPR